MGKQPKERLVEVQEVRKAFGEQKVLDGVSLALESGETISVLGRSGTGKSVLLKIMIGLQQPDSGSVRMLGQCRAAVKSRILGRKAHLRYLNRLWLTCGATSMWSGPLF
jgi:ABC-type transporter Mla maintaining outer membrane lipid asymmetry ATPase subunit MlaF